MGRTLSRAAEAAFGPRGPRNRCGFRPIGGLGSGGRLARTLGLAVMGALLVGTAGAAPAPVWAQEPTAHVGETRGPAPDPLRTSARTIAALEAALGAPGEETRKAAWSALTGLGREALPAIRQHLAKAGRLDPDAGREAITRFRHAVGSRRADDMVDVAKGVLPVLAEDRSATTVRVGERLALMRALEAIGTTEACRLIIAILAEDLAKTWHWEARHLVDRLGTRLLPAVVEAEAHSDYRVRRWARWALGALHAEQPGRAVQESDDQVLADLLRAYGKVDAMDAMPVVVGFVASRRTVVRDAARWTMAQYGQNGIWQLRKAYRIHATKDADMSWSWHRTMDEVYRAIDEERLGPVRVDLAAGLAAMTRGDLGAMERRFDAVLARAPGLEQRGRMAPGYALLGARRLDGQDLEGSARAYRRALALAPGAKAARTWRARLSFVEAERERATGLVDLAAYQRALALDPSQTRAAEAFDRLSGSAAARTRTRRRWEEAALALAFALLALVSMRRRRARSRPARATTAAAPRTAATDPLDPALDTLPG